ncbi:MAG: POTRA domain-containing protein, partial [Chloroflexota bacterium]
MDADLVREGENNLRDYFQRRGHFDVDVTAHLHPQPQSGKVTVEYHVEPGPDHKVVEVQITGNRYFRTETIRERMFIAPKGLIDKGRFSRQYLARDLETIRALYVANGFANVQVTSQVEDNYRGKRGQLAVRLRVEEGPQTLVRNLKLEGNKEIPGEELRGTVASGGGQPYSEFNVLLDRDTLLTHYFNKGFLEAGFAREVQPVEGRSDRVDLVYRISEGARRYVNRVLVSGLENTRRHIVDQQVSLEAGEPLSQLDLLETQRRLYDLGIFHKADLAVQNPEGEERHKNVLLQLEEARRYTISVGGGADIARFGGDDNLAANEGRTGFSPRVSFNVTRLNFRG